MTTLKDNPTLQKPVPKGMEANDAFNEYRALSRESREALKRSGFEQPDLSKEMSLKAQIEALQEVVTDQIESIRFHKARLDEAKDALHVITGALLAIHKGEGDAASHLQTMSRAITYFANPDGELGQVKTPE